MRLPTWEEIDAAPYDILSQLYWQPVPAFDADSRARVRAMAERLAKLSPSKIPDYLPLPPKPEPETPPPCPPKPKPKKAAPAAPDLDHFKSLFSGLK